MRSLLPVLPRGGQELRSPPTEHHLPDAPDAALQLQDERTEGGQPVDRRVRVVGDDVVRDGHLATQQRHDRHSHRRRRSRRVDGRELFGLSG